MPGFAARSNRSVTSGARVCLLWAPIICFCLAGILSCADRQAGLGESVGDGVSTALDKAGKRQVGGKERTPVQGVALVVLGTVQDAGSPQIGCQRACCAGLFENPDPDRKVVSLGLLDAPRQKAYLFEATPDLPEQLEVLSKFRPASASRLPDAIFLTHAHIGHYTGLMYLGKEAMDARQVPVYAMPRMRDFLAQNGPWSLLTTRENIHLRNLTAGTPVMLSESVEVIPIRVPHRDEFSETVGFRILGPERSALFIPDIDKWERWGFDIATEVAGVDYAFLDATFYSGKELGYRDMKEIPHPSVLESLTAFESLEAQERGKVVFIHFNHTNPLLDPGSTERRELERAGYRVAKMGQVFPL